MEERRENAAKKCDSFLVQCDLKKVICSAEPTLLSIYNPYPYVKDSSEVRPWLSTVLDARGADSPKKYFSNAISAETRGWNDRAHLCVRSQIILPRKTAMPLSQEFCGGRSWRSSKQVMLRAITNKHISSQ